MGSKKRLRRSVETGNANEIKRGELMAQNQGTVDLNVREDEKREKKIKVVDVDAKGNDDGCDCRTGEKEERKKEEKVKNGRKKKKIDVDEQQGERGDADICRNGSDMMQRKKEKKKKIQNTVESRDEKGRTDFAGVELDDGKAEEDIKKDKRKKKIVAERHRSERDNDNSVSDGNQQKDEMFQAEEFEVEKREENKKKRKRDKMKGEKQAKEKQNEEGTDGARTKRLGGNEHVSRGTTSATEVKCDNNGGDKGKEKEVGGNFNCSEDIQDTREPVETVEKPHCIKGKPGGEKNGGSNVESEEQVDGQSKCRIKERSGSKPEWVEVEEKGKLIKKGEKKNKKAEAITSSLEGTPGKSASKKVTFAENVEVFTIRDSKQDVLVGKRYTKEEDELLKQAVQNYIESHGLGEHGLEMVLRCRSHKQKGCWREISKSLPWRRCVSIYHRAHTLFERAGDRPDWSPEELELVMQYYKKHGPKWKQLAEALGKYRYDVKNMFRIINHGQLRKGKWTPEELETLYELVNKDLRMSANAGKKTHQGIFRDNIAWTAISEQLATRHFNVCCAKWYGIASPMVSRGIWNDSDDYRLVDALVRLDACSFVDVDWDNLLEHRNGELCVRRWKELIRGVDRHYSKTFMELVEILSRRYSWDVLEATEAVANATNDEAS